MAVVVDVADGADEAEAVCFEFVLILSRRWSRPPPPPRFRRPSLMCDFDLFFFFLISFLSFFFFSAGRFRVDNDNDAGEADDSDVDEMESGEDEWLVDILLIHDEVLGRIDDGGEIDCSRMRRRATAMSDNDNGWWLIPISGKFNSARHECDHNNG